MNVTNIGHCLQGEDWEDCSGICFLKKIGKIKDF